MSYIHPVKCVNSAFRVVLCISLEVLNALWHVVSTLGDVHCIRGTISCVIAVINKTIQII